MSEQEKALLAAFRLMNEEERSIHLNSFRRCVAGRALPELQLIVGGKPSATVPQTLFGSASR